MGWSGMNSSSMLHHSPPASLCSAATRSVSASFSLPATGLSESAASGSQSNGRIIPHPLCRSRNAGPPPAPPFKQIEADMTAKIIDGKAFAENLRSRIAGHVERLKAEHGITPGLAVVIVGEDPASQVYVSSKAKQTAEV